MVFQHRNVETQRRDVTEAWVFDFFPRRDVGTLRRYREGPIQKKITKPSKSEKTPLMKFQPRHSPGMSFLN